MANINRTRKIIGEGAEMKQFQIPTEARSKFVEIIKDDLIRDGGVVDTKALTNGNLTATAIKAARANLETRVSKFEWEAYKTATETIQMYLEKTGRAADFDITFNSYHLDNVTETVQNATMLRGTRSYATNGSRLLTTKSRKLCPFSTETSQMPLINAKAKLTCRWMVPSVCGCGPW